MHAAATIPDAATQRPSVPVIPGVWRGERLRTTTPTEPTGIRTLDDALLGGWPQSALTQILYAEEGFGFSLIVPTLARLTQAGHPVALIHTPHSPSAPGLSGQGVALQKLLWVQPKTHKQCLWSFEQLARSGLYATVAYWGGAIDGTAERRLQLAAQQGSCAAIHFCTGGDDQPTYAAARIAVQPEGKASIGIRILKGHSGMRPDRRLRHVAYAPVPLNRV